MPDLLVKLYELPDVEEARRRLEARHGVVVRRALPPERREVVRWVARVFGDQWASEVEVAFGRTPPACVIAVRDQEILGFSVYDTTFRGFLGPIGTAPEARGMGIGRVVLLVALRELWHLGYAYAIVGAAGPVEFFQRVAGAQEIPESTPGPYRGILRPRRLGEEPSTA